tara:strand:- start:14 stop:259 length:246 start_codon:yes stop_codon:yes gene_type:complete
LFKVPIILGIAYVVPGTLFAIANAWPGADVLAGLMVMGGGFYWKFMLVTQPCHQQGFALAKAPQLGSGARAAPAQLGRDAA